MYYWVIGEESPAKSRTELRTTIQLKDLTIDSLSIELDKLRNESPYRSAKVNTTANSLNLRSEPNLSSEVVIKIPDSSTVEILYFDEEILVLEGTFYDEHGAYPKGSWLRSPHLSQHQPYTKEDGALIYVKVGHLGNL